jgi:hypothetical protein
MPYFCVDGKREGGSYTVIATPAEAVKQLDARAKASIASALKRVKVTNDGYDISYSIESIIRAYAEASELRKLLGRASIHPKGSDLVKVRKHLEARFERYKELNTPEAIARRGVESQRRRELKEAKEAAARIKKVEEDKARREKAISDFRAGISSHGPIYLTHDLLRIQGNKVVTSRGARVNLTDARVMLRAIDAGICKEGATIGDFTLNGIRELPSLNDSEVIIGCHRILMSEARAVLQGSVP